MLQPHKEMFYALYVNKIQRLQLICCSISNLLEPSGLPVNLTRCIESVCVNIFLNGSLNSFRLLVPDITYKYTSKLILYG